METQAGDSRAFVRFDLGRVSTPAFVVDEIAIRDNLKILADVRDRSGAKILSALKAFSMWRLAPLISEYLDGCCSSGLWEARLATEKYSGELATYCPAYKTEDMAEILHISDHILFNNPVQYQKFGPKIKAARSGGDTFDIGLRINPEHSEGEVEKYDPCQPNSRLGFPVSRLKAEDLAGIDGLHFHSLCEQNFSPLERTWDAIKPLLSPYFKQLKWINFGGGHHITREDYDREALIDFIKKVRAETGLEVYLEPGEAVALDAGILVGEILDVMTNEMPIAITDISATCHMPDVIEAPYRPAMLNERETGTQTRLGGPSCLAGDIIGDYRLVEPVNAGNKIAFLDQAHYSMVKTNSFNGVPLPSIWLWNSETDHLELVKSFDYKAFRDRLS